MLVGDPNKRLDAWIQMLAKPPEVANIMRLQQIVMWDETPKHICNISNYPPLPLPTKKNKNVKNRDWVWGGGCPPPRDEVRIRFFSISGCGCDLHSILRAFNNESKAKSLNNS